MSLAIDIVDDMIRETMAECEQVPHHIPYAEAGINIRLSALKQVKDRIIRAESKLWEAPSLGDASVAGEQVSVVAVEAKGTDLSIRPSECLR